MYGDSPDTYTEAKDLYTRLETQGCNPWMDERGLEYGDILAEEIFWAIKQCDFIIFIMTSGYATSLWCLRELYYATLQEDRKKIMIGMLLEDDAVITNQKAGEWLLRMGTGQRYFKPTEDEKAAMVKLLKDKVFSSLSIYELVLVGDPDLCRGLLLPQYIFALMELPPNPSKQTRALYSVHYNCNFI